MRLYIPILLALLPVQVMAAADFQVSAGLDHQRIALNEQAMLSLTISGAATDLPQPQMPALPDFQVYNAGRAQNYSWVNGQASASVTYNYALTPLHEGHFTIPPIRIQYKDQTAETPALTLEVVKGNPSSVPEGNAGTAQPSGERRQGQPAIFITATVDKTTAYVGEPVTFIFRLYNRAPLLSNPTYAPPDFKGFWKEDMPPQREFQTTVHGLPYHVTEVRTALFPSAPGTLRIAPAALNVHLENLGTDPFSDNFFAQFFGRGEQKTLRTEPLTVHVKPLPDPKPAGFEGAVGKFSLSSNVDKQQTKVGEPVMLSVTVTGAGNIKSLPDVKLPALPNFRTLDSNPATNVKIDNYEVRGSKVFKTVLIPEASGDLQIPSLSYVYFDPDARSYKTLSSRAFTVHVTPGAPGSANAPAASGYAAPGVPSAPGAPAGPSIQMLAQDIRYIKTPSSISSQSEPLYRRAWFRWLHGIFLLLLLAGGIVRLYRALFLSNTRLTDFRNAKAEALARLAEAQSALDQSKVKDAASLLAEALHEFLSAKLSTDRQTISLKETLEMLKERGVHPHDTEKVRNLWETLDLFQFAPAQVRPDELRQSLRTMEHVIEEVEKDVLWKE